MRAALWCAVKISWSIGFTETREVLAIFKAQFITLCIGEVGIPMKTVDVAVTTMTKTIMTGVLMMWQVF